MKKILFGFIALILCFAFFNVFTAKQELQAQERTVAEQTYSDLEKQVLELQQQVFSQGYSYTVKENWVTRLTPAEKQTLCGYIPPKPPAKFISEKISFRPEPNQTKQFKKVALATKYDAMALGLVTPVKNQGSCGSCWIFGAVSDFESDVLIKEGATFNFSEQELGDCNIWARQGGYNFCNGGNSFMTDDYLTKYGGAQETCHPYAAYSQNCLSCPLIKNVNNTRMITGDDGESQSQIEIIKTALLNYGPLQSCMYASGPGFYAYNGGVYEYWGGEEINHAVTIIGWDDTKTHSHGTGAWLIKNSWGTSWAAAGPYPGCAWVAYGSANLGDYTNALAGYQTAGDKIFYHDECGWMGACTGCGSPTAYGAVRFIPESNTSLKAVDFWAVDTNLTYEIKIFDQLSQQGSSYSFSQQVGLTQTGSTNEPGYYSIPLNNPVPLVAGNDFIVQVKFTTTGYGYPLPLDYSNAPWLNWPGIAQFSGESYTSCNGTGYQKPCFAGVGCLDLGIRARAGAGGQPVPLKITTTSLPNAKVGVLYGQTLQAEGGTSPYAWSLTAGSLPNGINLNQDGKITGTPGQAGVFNFTVKVKDTLEATDQKNLSLTVEAANPPQPPPVPQLKAPPNYSTVANFTPQLEWYASNGATSYGLQVANDYYFSSLVINETGLTETLYPTPAGKLKPNTYYYWRVNATNENGTSNWSIYWRFKTPAGPQPPPVPQLKAPANYSTADSLAPKLEWYASNGATSYGLQVANDYYFSSLVINETGLTETLYPTPAGKLKPNTYYYWRVNATNENGTSNWSIYWRFKTPAGPQPPPVPQLKAPANYSTADSLAPKLEWYASNGATSYGLQVANDYYFSSLVINETGLTETLYPTPAGKLKPNTYYYWRVNATNENGTSNWSIYWRFKTPAGPQPPPVPQLKAPANYSTADSLAPKLEWYASNGATSYGLQVANDYYFSSLVINETGLTETLYPTPAGKLKPNTYYYWRVNATNENGTSNWSIYWRFKTPAGPQPPPVPQLKAPANYSTADSLAPKLEWYASNGATSYGLQVANDYYFSSLVINETGLTETLYPTPAGKLKPNTYYYWRVNATNENGTSNWSIYWRFKTPAGPQPPPVPQLKAPANYSTADSLAPKLEWYASNGATSYGLQVANDYYFSSLVINETGLTETLYPTPAGKLKPNTYYYWRVNATNENGTSNWSIYWRFKTPAAPSSSIAGWAVIIGVSDYQQINDLSYADDDAQDMYNRLISEGWKSNQIKVLINSQATKTNIKYALDWLKANAQSNDLCLFYFSGHGGHGPDLAPLDEADGQDEYLCPYDSLPNSWANDVRDDELDNWLATLTNKKVIMLDTCFSGGFIKTPTLTVKTKPGVSYRQLTDNFTKDIAKAGYETLTASDDHEFSYESSQLQNGVFTYYLEQGLAGGADANQDNKISAAETFAYAAPKTAAYTDNQQHPQFFDGIAGEVVVGEK